MSFSLAKEEIKSLLEKGDHFGHGYLHALRVVSLSERIAEKEGLDVDWEVLRFSALLHDVVDRKVNFWDENKLRKFLLKYLPDYKANRVIKVISEVGYSKFKEKTFPESIAVSDADMLDALGAIGIARAFVTGCKMSRSIFDTVDHFYEKLLTLDKFLITNYARDLARKRILFMKYFLKQFYKELSEDGFQDK